MSKYLPSSSWLSRRILLAPFPSALSLAQKWRKLARSARQLAKPMTESFSSVPKVTEVHQPGKNGLRIFKTSGPSFESKTHPERGIGRKKKNHCQMVFVLLDDDLERKAQNSTTSLCGFLRVSLPYSLPFSSFTWQCFNCLQFTQKGCIGK